LLCCSKRIWRWIAMALTAVTPLTPTSGVGIADDREPTLVFDEGAESRIQLTRPPDKDNELIKIAAVHGPGGLLSVIRSKMDYGWFVILGFRAFEVCLGPRSPQHDMPVLLQCDPIAFSMQMLEMEIIDEIFQLMKHYEHLKDAQRAGLAIIEILIMDDLDWRDEVARRGGVSLLCDIAKQRKDNTSLMCQVMTCMSYLAAEDYIEVMLCQHDALEYVSYVMQKHVKNAELITRASLALLNLTVCEPHVEELMDKGAVPLVLQALDAHSQDIHLSIILCGVLANLSVNDETRSLLFEDGVLSRLFVVMNLDSDNAVLQVACLKVLVSYSNNPEYYLKMDELGIPNLVERVMVEHGEDPGVQRFGNFFYGKHTYCPVL